MAQQWLAFLLAILIWWFSTGLIMILCALPRRTFGWSLLLASCVMVGAVFGLMESAWDTGAFGIYTAFLSALGIWGWIEMSFLMGIITGPRTAPCPKNAAGWNRFVLALQALLYHELTIAAAAALIVALTWGAPNQTGTLAFLILMAMRISTKLNIFFGVPHLTDEFLPDRLGYLKSYFRKREISALFPISLAGSALIAIFLAQKALGAAGAEEIGFVLLLSLTALAILEHFFLILPLPDAVLWRWAAPAKRNDKA